MELRVHNEVDALKSPTGYIPKYEDLRKLFKQVLGKNYAKEDYIKQFTIRVPENLAKIERVSRSTRKTSLTHHWNCSAYCTCNVNAYLKPKKNTATTFHQKNSKKKNQTEATEIENATIFHPFLCVKFLNGSYILTSNS